MELNIDMLKDEIIRRNMLLKNAAEDENCCIERINGLEAELDKLLYKYYKMMAADPDIGSNL